MKLGMLILFATVTMNAMAVPVVVEQAINPGCYVTSNQALLGAIQVVEAKARAKCGDTSATLLQMKVDIRRAGGCTPVTVTGRYYCGR